MKISNVKIGVRLGMSHALLLLLLAGVALCGIQGLTRANQALHNIAEVNSHKVMLLERMATQTHIVARVIRSIALLQDPKATEVEHRKIDLAQQAYDSASAELERMQLDANGQRLLAEIQRLKAATRPLNAQFLSISHDDRDAAVNFLLKRAGPSTTAWQNAIDEYIQLQETKSRKDQLEAEAAHQSALRLMLTMAVTALLLGAFIAWFITRSITTPMAQAVKLARTVAAGDLSSDIRVDTLDESGQLLLALRDMNGSLSSLVGRVRGGADTIALAAREIADGNLDLSSRTEQQASALEETASSMEELTSAVQQSAENAKQAHQMALTATETAAKGGQAVGHVIDIMEAINASSRRIIEIIGVIDNIAFQTNILALNAAVEAARAGDQGRGFAVVAAEVRGLAQRSAHAAKEIKTLIDHSVAQVDEGTRLVGQAGVTMTQVVASINDVGGIIAGITSASAEQSAGIDQINQAISEMDHVTQQNAALVEEAAAAAASMREQADGLTATVAVFKTGPAPLPAAARNRSYTAISASGTGTSAV
jgi:methyl-accepting chemotaxis protein